MYALLAICLSLSPTKIDESIASAMREKYGEQYGKMVRGGEASLPAFEELFTYASPKFLSLSSPPYDRPDLLPKYTASSSPSENPSAHHLSLFVADIKGQLAAPTLRSFLRLYTTLGADKLAGFMGTDEEEVVESLMVLKGAMKEVRRTEGEGGLLEGRDVLLGDLDFALDNVHFPLYLSSLPKETDLCDREFCTGPRRDCRDQAGSGVRRLLLAPRREASQPLRPSPSIPSTQLRLGPTRHKRLGTSSRTRRRYRSSGRKERRSGGCCRSGKAKVSGVCSGRIDRGCEHWEDLGERGERCSDGESGRDDGSVIFGHLARGSW